ncbi:unnamed protein product [Staurois parvus]|uniref:Uncharacterized protein n=1 Tax=Staurois parvus TaxID=386267 RepID=A0ABN9FRB8_9NEOB|nr:unnamed protein product [Staurois parvus]
MLLKLTAVNLHGDFLQPYLSVDAPVEVLTSVLTSIDVLDISVRWLQFHL